jgi:hypothetical protein
VSVGSVWIRKDYFRRPGNAVNGAKGPNVGKIGNSSDFSSCGPAIFRI